ncbi:GFA family protein [Sphingomonas sp. MS122]|uniref:GFA family protein n=1 Tax=Sphingomonas sp. MS122 TaxID=3412683 RepID=UPI003C2D13C0
MPVTGSCHCGKMSYTLEGDAPTAALACNCSICRRKGYLLHFAPAEQFTAHGDPDATTIYQFNRHNIRHTFCKTCGCAPYGGGTGPDGKAMAAINLRCADDIDLDSLTIHKFDGASL